MDLRPRPTGGIDAASVIAGPERTARVVELGLRQVERVLALDVAGADVVADREADQLSCGETTRASSGSGTHHLVSPADADRLARARRPGSASP